MDTTRDITYRGFLLNDSTVAQQVDSSDGLGKGIAGSVIDDFDPDDLDVGHRKVWIVWWIQVVIEQRQEVVVIATPHALSIRPYIHRAIR